MDFDGEFSSIVGRKEDKNVSWSLFRSYEINYKFYKKKILCLVSLKASIVFNDLSRVENFIYWTC